MFIQRIKQVLPCVTYMRIQSFHAYCKTYVRATDKRSNHIHKPNTQEMLIPRYSTNRISYIFKRCYSSEETNQSSLQGSGRRLGLVDLGNNVREIKEGLEPIPSHLHFQQTCTSQSVQEIVSSFKVVNDYINEEEEAMLMKEIEPHIKRLQYEYNHWDNAIQGFRETERGRWGKSSSPIISRMRKFAFPDEKDLIPQIHILDLAKEGVIKPHVDSVRFCGNTICGLCLLSDAVMRLVHTEKKDQVIDIMLSRRALYIMSDDSRYKYTHEVLGEKESFFGTTPVPRDRRVSIICRNHPKEENQ